jgi:hypothetical protein
MMFGNALPIGGWPGAVRTGKKMAAPVTLVSWPGHARP